MSRTPLLGAIAVVLTDTHVLLAQRKNQPDAGLWGFPGGHVELGETALAAAARELHEETGVAATPVRYLTNIDLVHHAADGSVDLHYLLAAVYCEFVSGTPVAADDVSDAAWVACADIRAGKLPISARVLDLMELGLEHRQVPRAVPRA